MTDTRDIIVRLLSNIASRNEVEQYLKQFAGVDSKRFAVIKVGGGILADQMDALVSALTFLQRIGLWPIVVHGAGTQLNETLAASGIETARVDGQRVTSPQVLEMARRVFQRVGLSLADALESVGTRARPITTGVFEATIVDREKLGLVGQVTRVHVEPIESCIGSGQLPILGSMGETTGGQILNINADVAARELALAVKPFKVVFLTSTGGLLDDQGQIISAINLAEDYVELMNQPWLNGGMRLKLRQIHDLLEALPFDSSVSITSPDHLARELFTHRGSGTLIRIGEHVRVYDSLETVDVGRLAALLEECFGRSLSGDYFSRLELRRIYLADSYRAAAIVTHCGTVPYLDKFAVTQEAQGMGIGGSIWTRLRADFPKLFWRSRRDNPINRWYFEHADGTHRNDQWVVFWYGLDGFDEVRASVECALALDASFRDEPVGCESDA